MNRLLIFQQRSKPNDVNTKKAPVYTKLHAKASNVMVRGKRTNSSDSTRILLMLSVLLTQAFIPLEHDDAIAALLVVAIYPFDD
jgi:hypothetical protein